MYRERSRFPHTALPRPSVRVSCIVSLSHPERLLEPSVVGDVLPLRHPPVDGQVDLLQLVLRVLVHDAGGGLAKVPDRLVVPPLLEVALLVELAALVVKAVGDLVADYHADAAVVQRLGEVLAVEQRLEDPRGKH